MLGKITIERNDGDLVAVLTDRRVWVSEDQTLADYLNLHFSPLGDTYGSPSQGQPGAASVIDAAYELDAYFDIPKMPPGEIGTIY